MRTSTELAFKTVEKVFSNFVEKNSKQLHRMRTGSIKQVETFPLYSSDLYDPFDVFYVGKIEECGGYRYYFLTGELDKVYSVFESFGC